MKILLLSVMMLTLSSNVEAKVYQCVSANKHVLYQDRPCDHAGSSTHSTQPTKHAPQQDVRSALIGEWLWSKKQENITMQGHLSIRNNGTFVSSFTIADKPVMDSSGTWSYHNRKIVWTYKTSSIPLPFKEDIDEVLSAMANKLILKAQLDGKIYTLKRVK